MSDIPEFGVYKGMMTSYEESLKMSDLRIIKEKGFYDQHGNKKFALLEEGQTVKIESHPRSGSGPLLCRVVNPSKVSKDFGVRDGMLVEVHWDFLGLEL